MLVEEYTTAPEPGVREMRDALTEEVRAAFERLEAHFNQPPMEEE